MLFEQEGLDDGLTKYTFTVKDIDMKDFGEISLAAKNMAGEAASICTFAIVSF